MATILLNSGQGPAAPGHQICLVEKAKVRKDDVARVIPRNDSSHLAGFLSFLSSNDFPNHMSIKD